MGLTIPRKEKAMIVSCDYAFCAYNYDRQCSLDKICICHGGVCDMAIDRTRLDIAAKVVEEQHKMSKGKIVYKQLRR